MATVIDTCSLVSLAKNYLPLDENGSLMNFIHEKFVTKEWVMLDAIQRESQYTSQGIVMKSMPFLKDSAYMTKTNEMYPPSTKKLDNMLDRNFSIPILKRDLSDEEYIVQKDIFLKSGDGRILVYCLNMKSDANLFSELCVLTEESRTSNDGKLFKKLPLICEHLEIKVISLPDYLKANGFRVEK